MAAALAGKLNTIIKGKMINPTLPFIIIYQVYCFRSAHSLSATGAHASA